VTHQATTPAMNAEARETLRRLAEQATKGPWQVFEGEHGRARHYFDVVKPDGEGGERDSAEVLGPNDPADAAYIAAANPAVVLALLDALDAREWRPIETAPKDGSAIIAYDPGGTFPNGGTNPACVGLASFATDQLNGSYWRGPGTPKGYPTHWQPLPPSPSPEER
jgi:hypothetical protein